MRKKFNNKYLLVIIVFILVCTCGYFFFSKTKIDDYYNYINEDKVEKKKDDWSIFGDSQKKVDKELRTLIEKESQKDSVFSPYYNAYLDTSKREKYGLSKVQNYIDLINNTSDINSFILTLGRIEKELNVNILLQYEIMQDFKTEKVGRLYIMPFGFDHGFGAKYYSDEDYASMNATIQKYNIRLLKAYGYSNGASLDFASALNDFYFSIAKDSTVFDESNYEKYYNIVSLKKMGELLNNIPFEQYFNELGFENVDVVSLVDDTSYKALNKQLTNDNLDILKKHATMRILQSYSRYADEKYDKVISGLEKEMVSAEKYNIKTAAANFISAYFVNEVDNLYAQKYFSKDNKEFLNNITSDIIEEYANVLSESWLSKATKENAINKLKNIKINIGFEYDKDKSYKYSYNDSLPLIDNVIEMNRVVRDKKLSLLNKYDESDELSTTLVNAYYNPLNNSINILSADVKLFDQKDGYYKSLGSVGFIIAHEISHAFDNVGAKFDSSGLLNNWWTESDYNNYKKVQKKIIKYYDDYEVVYGLNVNGKKTIGENIADLGAMHCIVSLADKKKASNDEFKMIFESYASLWANNYASSYLILSALQDVHSPNRVRVNAVLSSTDKFYEVYKINKSDKMYVAKEKRIKIW